MYEKFEELLAQRGITAYRVAKDTGITTATFTSWKQGKYTPKREKLQKVADYFGVSIDYFTGSTLEDKSVLPEDKPYYALTSKDELDIAVELEQMMDRLNGESSLAFMGEPMDEEDRELLRISLENTLRLSKEIAKKKFTPKKYRR